MSGPPHISDDYDTSPELLTWSHLNNFMMPKEVKLFSIKTFYCQLFSIKTSLQRASHQHKVLGNFLTVDTTLMWIFKGLVSCSRSTFCHVCGKSFHINTPNVAGL